jgi:MoaA/NifB/PqqE/SkfB family radical SAM enzyme
MLRWGELTRSLRRTARSIGRRQREARMFARAMASKHHPILAQIVPIRRCNLACAYCNEFDAVSAPVPLAEMLRRVDLLAGLCTTIITISGGEPMLHPELHVIIRRIRSRGSIATLITNGYLLTPESIRRLNYAGLDYCKSASTTWTRTRPPRRALRC